MGLKALIVEDVPAIAMNLVSELKANCPEIITIEMAHNVLDGLKAIKSGTPDLLFLDVDLGDSNGFELLDLLPPDLELPVVFTTGSEIHAVKAFAYDALDYLLKPVDGQMLKKAVAKALGKRVTVNEQRMGITGRDKIVLHTQDSIEIVPVEAILHCQADGGYTYFALEDGRKLMVSNTLKTYEQMLDGLGFVRVHQSHLINFSKVRSFIKAEGGFLELIDGSRIPVSHRKKALVMQTLDQYL